MMIFIFKYLQRIKWYCCWGTAKDKTNSTTTQNQYCNSTISEVNQSIAYFGMLSYKEAYNFFEHLFLSRPFLRVLYKFECSLVPTLERQKNTCDCFKQFSELVESCTLNVIWPGQIFINRRHLWKLWWPWEIYLKEKLNVILSVLDVRMSLDFVRLMNLIPLLLFIILQTPKQKTLPFKFLNYFLPFYCFTMFDLLLIIIFTTSLS